MEKNTADSEQRQQINHKQLSKLKHLAEEHLHLKTLVNTLEQINYKSKSLLRGVSDRSKKAHLDSTACSAGLSVMEPSLSEEDVKEMEGLVASLDSEIQNKKEFFEAEARRQERNKVEEQVLFRRMLYEYEEKLASIKTQIKLREDYIQEVERQQKDNKTPILEHKILGVYPSSFQLFDEMCDAKEQLKQAVIKTSSLEAEIAKTKDEAKSLEQAVLKLKVAKEAKMPYYRFKAMLKNDLGEASEENKDDYAALYHFKNQIEEVEPKRVSSLVRNNKVTPEMLYLIIRKEEMNREILQRLIRQEDQKQEELQANNYLLKQAIKAKESEQHMKEVEARMLHEKRLYKEKNEERYSEGGELVRPNRDPPCDKLCPTDYQMYLQKLRHKVNQQMSSCLWFSPRRSLQKSKSSTHIIEPLSIDDEASEIVTAKFVSERSLLSKYNDMVTDRFFDEVPEYEFIE